jgi:hypothetical protein
LSKVQTLQAENVLSRQEAQRLRELELIIERSLDTFLQVGASLIAIRDGRLYRATHPTFASYCHERWALSLSRCNQLIGVVKVYDTLTNAFPQDVPVLEDTHESALRPLSRLAPELQQAAWELVKRIEERPSGVTIAETVATIRGAIEAGWQARESSEPAAQTTEGASVHGRNGDRRNGAIHGASRQPRMSDLLAALCRWARRVAEWDPEAIVAGDDSICMERHLNAARTINKFCTSIIVACNERKNPHRRCP